MIKYQIHRDGILLEFLNYSLAQVYITEHNLPESSIKEISETSVFDKTSYIRDTVLLPAMAFAKDLVEQFTSENVGMGITQAGKSKIIADTLKDASFYLSSGSLYEAIRSIDAIVITPEMSPFITRDRMIVFSNKIRVFLNIPQV